MQTESIHQMLSLTDLDYLIAKKITEANIVFYVKNVQTNGFEGVKEDFKNEMLSKDPLTVIEYLRWYIDPIRSVFPEQMTDCPEEYYPLLLLMAGYSNGAFSMKDELRMPSISPHYEKLNAIFSSNEFEQIQLATKELYGEFKKEVGMCKADFLKDKSKENSENHFVEKLIDDLVVGYKTGNQLEVFKSYANQESISKMTSWYGRDKLHQIIGSPVERLFMVITKSLLYLEILHHAGYASYPGVGENGFENSTWRKMY
jgi:hypothetical protein